MKRPRVHTTPPPLCAETCRDGKVISLGRTHATGTGAGFRDHVPLTVQLRVNQTTGASLPSLLDTGASLSVIDEHLLTELGGVSQGEPMDIHGIGDTRTKGWVTLTVFIPATDPDGKDVHLEVSQDFHVLPHFTPGLCLGLDFITGHAVHLLPASGRANVGRFVFPVHERLTGNYATEAELRNAEDVTLPAGQYTWVPVRAMALLPGVEYTVHPRLTATEDSDALLAGPTGLLRHKARSHVLLGNFGTAPVALSAGTVVADALAAKLGDRVHATPDLFALTPGRTEDHGAALPEVPPDVAPVDPFADEDESVGLTRDAATTLVDGVFKVGVDGDGHPPAPVVDCFRRHSAAFATDGRPGLVRGHEMPIDLKADAALRPEPPRRMSPEKRRAADAAIDQLLSWDVIEPSSSPVSFPVLMVRQYDKWRFCVDYRQLNAHTVADRYPLPTIDSVFQTLLGKRIFSSLDALRGYHQMPVREADRWKTAFVCHRGLFQYKTVPFGLRNAPAVFQRLMDRILGGLRWRHAVVYIDDIVVATETLEEHVAALDQLLSSATAAGLRFSPGQCTFAVPALVLLGRKVSGAGVAVWADRARAVERLSRPCTLRELYHALGLLGYYRAFVPGFAERAEPLTRLLRGWKYEADAAGRYRLVGPGGDPASADRTPVAWDEEQQRAFDDLKAAVASPPTLAHPDPRRPYVLYVDASKSAFAAILHQVHSVAAPSATVSLAAAAFLASPLAALPPPLARERWTAWLRADRHFGPLWRRLDAGAADEVWVLEDGVMVHRPDGRLALPDGALPAVLRSLHDDAGHFGFLKTFLAVSKQFCRPGLSLAVRAWVRHCRVCLATKRAPKVGRLDTDADPQFPFSTVSIDIVHGLPRSRSGNESFVAILDVFSRMVLLEPCPASITAEGVAAVLSDRVLRYGWRPRRIVADSESRVSGAVMAELARSLHAELTPSPPYHQQANAVERAVQTIQRVMSSLATESRAHWDRRILPAVELAMNAAPSVVTGFRPFDLVFVSHPDVAHALFDDDGHPGVASFAERLAAAESRLLEARTAIAAARREQRLRYERRRRELPDLRPGDEVYVRLSDRPVPGVDAGKLAPAKDGPYRVREVLSPHRVRLELPSDARISDEFSVEQLDCAPSSPDPFAPHRSVPAGPSPPGSPAPRAADAVPLSRDSVEEAGAPLPARRRLPPGALREFDLGVAAAASPSSATLDKVLRGPIFSRRVLEVDGVSVEFRERPVAFLSRLTSPAERGMVASELELRCLAGAFAKWAHLLEGAEVTVVTDHAPLGPMLTSTAATPYGPNISRCRAMLMPHLPNLRFVHRAGARHTNVDALSRLPPA